MDQIESAMEIGRENRRAQSLVANHCLHARVTISLSPLGASCGLPIGPAEIQCEHAPFFGLSTINLTDLAVEFYEKNCVECPHRAPNGRVPTIASVVEERRRAAQEAHQQTLASRRQIHEEWQARKTARDAAMLGQPYAVRDLADQITIIDKEPQGAVDEQPTHTILDAIARIRDSQPHEDDPDQLQARSRILETARRAPQLFHEALIETIATLAQTSDPTAHSALRLLAQNNLALKARAASIAAATLKRRALPEAGQTVAAFSDVLSREEVKDACKGAIYLCSEPEHGFAVPQRAAEPAALIALARAQWQTVLESILEGLSDGDKWHREAAAHAARHLLRESPLRVGSLGEPLIRAISGHDQNYAGEPAPDSAAVRALAQAWLAAPQETSGIIDEISNSLSDDVKAVLSRLPRIVLREGQVSETALRQSIEFLLRRLDLSWGEDSANEASDDLRWLAHDMPSALISDVDSLIGALMRECQPLDSPSLLVPAEMSQLRALEQQTARIRQGRRRSDIAETLGLVGKTAPEELLGRVFRLLHATTGDQALDRTTRSALIEILKETVTSQSVARILPPLYTYLLSEDQVMRSAAIGLWQACARVAAQLPDELSDLAPSLLSDPYVIVHGAMARSLSALRLSEELARSLFQSLLAIAIAHRDDDKQILEDALYALLWAARSDPRMQEAAAEFAIALCASLDPLDREHLLLCTELRKYRSTETWGSRAVDLLADSARSGLSFSQRDDRLLKALLDDPAAVKGVPIEKFIEVANVSAPRSMAQAAEMIELLQASGRWRDATQLANELAAPIPQTLEYRNRRDWFNIIQRAAAAENALAASQIADGTVDVSSEVSDSEPMLIAHLRARAMARAALRELPTADPLAAAERMNEAIRIMDETPGGDQRVGSFVDVLRAAEQLLRYDAATRESDSTQAQASLDAARRIAHVMESTTSVLSADDPIRTFAFAVRDVTYSNLDGLLSQVRSVPLALPLSDRAFRKPRRERRDESPAKLSSSETVNSAPLAVCVFELDGEPIFTERILRDVDVHDLTIDLRLEDWPEWADACRVQLLSALPPDALVLPEFEFQPSDAHRDEQGVFLSRTGTLMFRGTRPPGSKPLNFPVHIQFTSKDGRCEVATVAGIQRLLLCPYDPTRDQLTRDTQMDPKLLEMYSELRDDKSLDRDDVDAFCRFFTCCVRVAQRIMFEKSFRAGTTIDEKQFHDAFEERLRAEPDLGERLTRRDAVAGGFDDLLHDDIIAELKVEKKTVRRAEDCARYLGQPTQYGVGRGSRLSILVVLDHTVKNSPPATLENYVGWLYPAQHGLDDLLYPSRVGVLVLPTNWPVPSTWSRRRIRTLKRR
jgi:hypothetical protein